MKYSTSTDKQDYIQLCETEAIPLFSQHWWLDATAGESDWSVVLVKRGGEIVCSLPFMKKTKYGFTQLGQPKLTQHLGPWIRPSEAKYAKAKAFEKKVMTVLVEGLPKHDRYHQNWNPAVTNWLPFYWMGFKQTTRYTYQLSCKDTKECLWGNLQENIRREIQKARNRYNLKLKTDATVEDFIELNKKTFDRQGKKITYKESLVQSIYSECKRRNCCTMLIVADESGAMHSGSMIVRDSKTAYYLMGGSDPQLRTSGAASLCLWESILAVKDSVSIFDFEGSMIEPVERFFRGFGAKQIPFHQITKTNSTLIKLYSCIRS